MASIESICVYCGSSPGTDPAFSVSARRFGTLLAEGGIRLVYGGGGIGLMGEVAEAAAAAGGAVTGIIPDFLMRREKAPQGEMELIVVDDMHARKRLMFERADAFVALPGGIGTLEELVEQLTWAQLGQHRKPVLIANLNGFWDPFIELIGHMRDTGFIRAPYPVDLLVAEHVEDIVPRLQAAADAVAGREPAATAEVARRM